MGYQINFGPRLRHIEKFFYWSWNYFFRYIFFSVCLVATAPLWILLLCAKFVFKDEYEPYVEPIKGVPEQLKPFVNDYED
jgi:hypothetical protein